MPHVPAPSSATDRRTRQFDDAMTALIRLLARQAAREFGADQNPEEDPHGKSDEACSD